ncbi:MAG: bifunctional riboflavin kinase/FAD synthetase [Burkholderiales bacterium]|uniref:bifunctional riboflavin kinase/FAD synthetase n=1 Tax=Inhella sp. TaxID=1921806 RepID=UPI001ACA6433|nr:bifunctional riboflavin kinase/FAD synthetase [Burkholderiales bacterium]
MQVVRRTFSCANVHPTALTIGNFDGVHRGHQAMLALLRSEAQHRRLSSTVLSFQPHPRDYFAHVAGRASDAPRRISTLRDKVMELQRCGIDRLALLRFDAALAQLSPRAFVENILVNGLGARYVLVGDDFRFGAKRQGDYATLDALGSEFGFDVARMMSYEVHGQRVSSSSVREALAAGDMTLARALLGRPYCVSGHVLHGQKLGRQLGPGYPTLNLRFRHARPAAQGIFVVQTHGLTDQPLHGVASLGSRPTVDDSGRMLLEVHCLDWPATLGTEGGYGRLVRVEFLHKLRDEARYDGLDALTAAIAADVQAAHAWFAASHAAERRQTTRDRI